MIDIEKPGVKSAQEPVDEKQEKDLANTENISGDRRGVGLDHLQQLANLIGKALRGRLFRGSVGCGRMSASWCRRFDATFAVVTYQVAQA